MNDPVRLVYGDRQMDLPMVAPTMGDWGIDISRLRAELGLITVDRGFGNTSQNPSSVSFVNGEAGTLSYRGYPIEELAGRAGFLEVAWLLLYGELPTSSQLASFEEDIRGFCDVTDDLQSFLDAFPPQSNPMAILAAGVLTMGGRHPEASQNSRPDMWERAIRILLAEVPILAALINRRLLGLGPITIRTDLPYTARFYHAATAQSDSSPLPDSDSLQVLEVLELLHSDHGQNCSSSAVQLVGSGRAGIFASVSAGISALSGPLHGGANQRVLEMLEQIHTAGEDVTEILRRAKDRTDPFRLMGFGHRVYRNYDPRARIIKRVASQVLARSDSNDPLLQLAKELESAALADEYFSQRKLYPNVDFYSGFLYRALGFPTEMFTVLFAIGRLPGWLSHWREMASDPKSRIFRPRQVYVGQAERKLDDRE